jgi:hypothetical protein
MQRPNDRRCNETEEEGSGKERSGDLHLPETDAKEEDTDNLGNVTWWKSKNHCFSFKRIEYYNDDDDNDNDDDDNMTCTGGMNIVYNYDGRHSRRCRH